MQVNYNSSFTNVIYSRDMCAVLRIRAYVGTMVTIFTIFKLLTRQMFIIFFFWASINVICLISLRTLNIDIWMLCIDYKRKIIGINRTYISNIFCHWKNSLKLTWIISKVIVYLSYHFYEANGKLTKRNWCINVF